MGTSVSFDIRPPAPGAGAVRRAVAWLHHVDAIFSTYKEDSEISRLGRGEVTVDGLSSEAMGVMRRCQRLGELTLGAFDVLRVPAPNGATVDPSAFVKGWSIQAAADMLVRAGAINLCINGGGDIALRGSPEPGHLWRVGVRHPRLPLEQATVLHLAGPVAVATSATYERGNHIINPWTGEPATDLVSVTVVGPDLGDADAFATAVFVMGADGLSWIEDQADYEAYIIDRDDAVTWTSGFPVGQPA